MDAELYNLYFKSLLQKENINIKDVSEEEYALIASHIQGKISFIEWYKNVMEVENFASLLSEGELANMEQEKIPTKEEQATHNEKLMSLLPKAAKEQLEAQKKSA